METNKPPPTPDPAELRAACKHAKRLRDFYRLCLIVTLVVPLTGIVNATTRLNRLSFVWAAFGFAIALGSVALDTFGRKLWLGLAWQEREVRQLLARPAH